MKTKLLLAVVILSVYFTFSQNLVAYYPFNGNANDESGNANNGTVSGATLTPNRFGNVDSAYSFNGTNNYIQCLSPGPTGSSPRTISFWAKTNLLPSVHSNVVLSYGGDAGSFNYGDRIEISLNSYNRYGLVLSLGGSVLIREFDNSDNNWHFYTIAFEGGSGKHIADFKMYADGNLLTNTTYLTGNTFEVNTSSNYPILIGNLTSSYRYFNGSIDDIKVYDKALTETEIQSEFENLLAYYPFNGNANDLSGNGHDGSVFEASLTLDKDGNPDSAYLFDGVNDYIDIGDWTNGGAMSFTFWARWDAFNSYSRIVDLGNGSSSNNIIVGNYQTQNSLFFSAYNGATETKMWTPTITLGQWDFYTTTVDANGIMTIYKNGIQIDQRTDGFTPNYLLRTEQFIGKSNFIADKYFKGAIDDIRIYSIALSPSEITSLYNNGTLSNDYISLNQKNTFYVNNNMLTFNVNQNLYEIKTISIFDLLAQKVFESDVAQKETSLNFLNQGIYIVKITFEKNKIETKKIVIQ
jgi:hypothetical protein